MSQTNLPNKILLVDDDPTVAQGLEEQLLKHNVRVEKATNLETALYMFNKQRYDVALIEMEFGPLPGLALVQKWRQHEIAEKQCTAFIVMTGNKGAVAKDGLFKELGDLEIITKPFGVIQILPYLSRGLAAKQRAVSYLETKSKVLDYYGKTGDFDKAAKHVEKQLSSLGPRGLNMLYDLYEKGGRFGDALALINGLLEKDQNNIQLLNAKGRMLMRLNRFQEAKDALKKADELAPQNIDRINELASAYLHLKDPDNAVKSFQQLLALSPEKPEAKFDMFGQLCNHGFDDHAVQFGREVAKPAEIVKHYNNKGVLLSKEGQGAEALTEYQRALRFFPKFKENYRIYFNIGLAYAQQKTPEGYNKAHEALKLCVELSPDFEKGKKALEQVERVLASRKKAS